MKPSSGLFMADSEQPEMPPAEEKSEAPGRDSGTKPSVPRRPRGRTGPVRSLEGEQLPRSSLHLKDLDAEIEGELQATLAELSDKDLQGGELQRRSAPAAPGEGGGKKGRVLSVH